MDMWLSRRRGERKSSWKKGLSCSGRGYGEEACPPVVVEPGAVTGNDDVVCLLCHIVLAGVHQPIHLHLALLLIVLQMALEGGRERGGGKR